MGKEKKPKIRFKGFTSDWEQRRLRDIIVEKNEKISDLQSIPLYSLTIENGVTPKTERYERSFLVTKTTDLFKKVSSQEFVSNPMNLRFGAIGYNKTNKDISISGYYDVFSIDQNKCSNFWLSYFKTRTVLKIFDDIAIGSLLEKRRVHFSNLITIKLLEPNDLKEKIKMGETFSHIDKLITLHQRKCEKLQNIKKSLLEKMFPKNNEKFPEIRFKGFTNDWEQCKLGKIGETYTGLSGKCKDDFGHGAGKYITYMNVFSNVISDISMVEAIDIDKNQNEVVSGDVFFTTSSETPEEVGMSSVLLKNVKNMYLNSFCFGYRPKIKFDNYYLAYVLRSTRVRDRIIVLAQGISRYNISKNKMMDVVIPIPLNGEQEKIGQFLKKLDKLITLHQRQIEKLQHIKKSLLEKMFI